MFTEEELKEIKCLRAVLERILRVMDEGLFVDYQMEKFGKINYTKDMKIEDVLKCHKCGKPFKKVTKYEWKYGCNCFPDNIRISCG